MFGVLVRCKTVRLTRYLSLRSILLPRGRIDWKCIHIAAARELPPEVQAQRMRLEGRRRALAHGGIEWVTGAAVDRDGRRDVEAGGGDNELPGYNGALKSPPAYDSYNAADVEHHEDTSIPMDPVVRPQPARIRNS